MSLKVEPDQELGHLVGTQVQPHVVHSLQFNGSLTDLLMLLFCEVLGAVLNVS